MTDFKVTIKVTATPLSLSDIVRWVDYAVGAVHFTPSPTAMRVQRCHDDIPFTLVFWVAHD